MMSDPRFVFIHLGDREPLWLQHSITTFRLNVGSLPLVVVDSERLHRKFTARGLDVMTIEVDGLSLPRRPELPGSIKFRDGFWDTTTRRFWHLAAVQRQLNAPMIHIESDILVFPNFPVRNFGLLDAPLAVPLSAPGYGVASVFYSRDQAALIEMLSRWSRMQIDQLSVNQDPLNDMTRLGRLMQDDQGLITAFPTLQPDQNGARGVAEDWLFLMARNFPVFGGIFDAATYGQYLFGLDPRNEKGLRRVFRWREYHTIRPQTSSFLEGDQLNPLLIGQVGSSEAAPIFNLHVHSKDVRALAAHTWHDHLRRRLEQRTAGTRYEFSFWGLRESLRNRIRRHLP